MKKDIEKMKKAGYRITKTRQDVLSILDKAKKPLSATEIWKFYGKCDLVSIYRNLAILEKLSMINVDFFNGEKLYCISKKPHHHIICRKCGKIESFECDHNFENFKNFTQIKHQVSVSGICRKCNS